MRYVVIADRRRRRLTYSWPTRGSSPSGSTRESPDHRAACPPITSLQRVTRERQVVRSVVDTALGPAPMRHLVQHDISHDVLAVATYTTAITSAHCASSTTRLSIAPRQPRSTAPVTVCLDATRYADAPVADAPGDGCPRRTRAELRAGPPGGTVRRLPEPAGMTMPSLHLARSAVLVQQR